MWWNIRPESGQEPGLLVHRFVACTRGVLMGAHDRRIDADLVGQLAAVWLHVWPEVLPEGTRFPTAKAVRDGIPVANVVGYIPPWNTSTSLIQHSCNAQTVIELRRTAGVVLNGPQDGFQVSPNGIGDHKTYGHRSFPPQAKFRGNPIAI